MRHLLMLACVCLATLSGTLGSDPELSLAQFSGDPLVNQKSSEDTVPADNDAGESSREKDAPRDFGEFSMFSPDATTGFDGNWELSPVPPPLPPRPKPIVHRSRQEICDTLTEAAQSNGVPTPFFIRLLFQESGFKPGVVSSTGAEGIAQFMPQTSADMGLDNPFDPLPAIRASARLLRSLVQQFGNLGLAAAAYNAGPKRITEWLAKKGKLPRETQGYVKSITGRPPEKWIIAEAGSPAVKLPRRAPCQEVAGLLAWNGPERIPLPPARPPLNKPAHHIMTVVARRSTNATRHAVRAAAGGHKSRRLQLSQR
jgi:Transglycosylase SLT domain